MELKDPPACDSSLVQIEALDGFETEHEVTLETMEFDFILPSMELINPPVCNESEPFSCNDIGEEESFITYTVSERSELIPDEEPLEESLIAPLVVESSHASSDKEESLIAPPVSECTEDEGVLEDESEYTDDHNEEVEVSEDNEKEVAAAQNDEMDTPSEDVSDETPRVNSAVLPSIELVNPPVCNESEPFSWDDIGEEESFITYTVNERSELIPDEEPLEESLIAPLVVESSHASSDKEESLIAPPVSECTEDEGVLEDESEYTDDHNEEVEVSEDNEKEVAAAQNDEMDTPSEDVSDETPRVNSAVLPSIELVNPPVCNESEPFSWDDIGEEESFITYTVNERSELIPDEEPLENEGVLEDESEYTDDHNEEVEVSEDNEKEVAAAQNDEMDTPSEDVSDETPRVNSAVLPSIELVNPPVCNESEPFSWDDIGEEESSHASSDKEESLIAPPVSECTEDEGVLEDESEYTDDHNEEVEVSEDESKSTNNEKEVAAAQNDEMDTPSEETPRVKSAIPNYLRASTGSCHDIYKYGKRHEHVSKKTSRVNSAILPSMELVNPLVSNESEPFSRDDIGEKVSFITYTVNERSELIPDEELPENSTIMATVIASFHAFSDKEVSEESLIVLLVSESTQDEGVAAAQNDEMETTARVQDKVRRKGRGVIFEDTNDKGGKLKFRRGKVLDIQSENNDSKNGRKSKRRPPAHAASADNQALADWNALFDRHNEVACLMLGTIFCAKLQYAMEKTISEVHSLLIEFEKSIKRNKQQIVGASSTPHVMAIQSGRVQKNKPQVSMNNMIYLNAITVNDIYEIDMRDSTLPIVNSMYSISNKRTKPNLDSSYLWHCRLAHINKKRIEKLQHDGLLKPTDNEPFDQCVSCISGKMTRKPFSHKTEKVKDVLGLIHTDVCGPPLQQNRPNATVKIRCIFVVKGYLQRKCNRFRLLQKDSM
ncbi:retrotransposon protein, putative, ty1-copia subclass [Tanacetum coccineum]